MEFSVPSLTAEMLNALNTSGGLPIQVQDPTSNKRYLLVEQIDDLTDADLVLCQELAKGLADYKSGLYTPWDIRATIAEAQRQFRPGDE
jgi:hypothetical protein